MVNSMVERATSDLLMGPDWAINVEICDMLNHDPGQARSVFKGIKKRLGSKNPKVQLLTLTLLETLVHSCGGDIVHMHIADRDIIHDMVKIVKKKPDFLVKEKILALIDMWQRTFGGPGSRYSQYYAAHQELSQYGAVFRAEGSTPVFTPPPQIQPFLTYPSPTNLHGNSDNQQQDAAQHQEADFPTLSSTEIENARGVMNVLSEMLNAIDPENKEGLKEEVIVDLVEQCRNYKQSILHLVSSTTDEALLHQGLALNDDLQRILAKHEAIASGTPEDPKPEPHGSLIDIDTGDNNKDDQQGDRSTSTAGASKTMDPKMDLLSFDDDFTNSPKTHPSNALVPVGDQQSAAAATPNDHNALVLLDMFSDDTPTNPPPHTVNADGGNLHGQSDPYQQHTVETASPELATTTTGAHGPGPSPFDQPYYTQNNPAWNSHAIAPQQPPSPNSTSLPPPPWEVPSESSSTQTPQEMHAPGVMLPHEPWSEQQPTNVYMMPPQQQQVGPGPQYSSQPNQMMQGGPYMMAPGAGQMPYMYVQPVYGGQPAGAYGYGQAGAQYVDQRVQGLSVRDDSGIGSAKHHVSSSSSSSYLPPMRASKPEDKLFGDLVDMAKVKQSTTSRGRFGSM